MYWVQFKNPLCDLCFPGTRLTSLSLAQDVTGSKTIYTQKYSKNSVDSVNCA